MGKFSLCDFLSFTLSCFTFISLCMVLFTYAIPTAPKGLLFIIPFAVTAYYSRHLLSLLSLQAEKKNYQKPKIWLTRPHSHLQEVQALNPLGISKFKLQSFINSKQNILKEQSGKAYAYNNASLEVREKDSRIKRLMAQHGFFPNIVIFFVYRTFLVRTYQS